jgi:hypothetical protein
LLIIKSNIWEDGLLLNKLMPKVLTLKIDKLILLAALFLLEIFLSKPLKIPCNRHSLLAVPLLDAESLKIKKET